MIKLIALFLLCVYNLTLLGGTAYLVTVWQWSPYWFIVAILLLGKSK